MKNIIEIAKGYVGQEEVKGNMGFKDENFQAKMVAVGWKEKHPWCAYAQELIFKEAYPELFDELDRLFSASAVETFNNFKDAGYTIYKKPVEGSLVIWQKMVGGKKTWQGHAGLCGKVKDGWLFESYEGNTNKKGSREGDVFTKKNRRHLKDVPDGLKILGFIKIGTYEAAID